MGKHKRREYGGIVNGGLTVTGRAKVTGVVNGGLTLAPGANVKLPGTVNGGATVGEGAKLHLSGVLNGPLVNEGGRIVITGVAQSADLSDPGIVLAPDGVVNRPDAA